MLSICLQLNFSQLSQVILVVTYTTYTYVYSTGLGRSRQSLSLPDCSADAGLWAETMNDCGAVPAPPPPQTSKTAAHEVLNVKHLLVRFVYGEVQLN